MPKLFRRTHVMPLLVALGMASAAAVAPAASVAASRSAHLGDRALRPGASGRDVRELQRLLRQVGVKVKKVDGTFGAGTVKAVKQFQAARGLTVSGVVGRITVTSLRQAAMGGAAQNLDTGGYDDSVGTGASKSLGDRIPVRAGMSGHDVKVLQDFLKRAGLKVTVDGEFGAGTVTAVKSFERTNKLDVNGLVDANDIAVLRGQVAAGPKAASAATPAPLATGDRAEVGEDGLAIAPANAPDAVKQIIAAGNVIAKKPYIYGGGHGKWDDAGYDCSGSVSYALHGAGLLKTAMASGDFEGWGSAGPGQWVTLYANSGHIYMVVAGLRYDTSGAKQDGSRWHASVRPTRGYTVRHPAGL